MLTSWLAGDGYAKYNSASGSTTQYYGDAANKGGK